ncbi:alpha/beta fold hydrolase [Arsenicibacter rosenii]|uniref:S9 family peptidase n=1 Tax=Arsenicibacter rosenii TaxID=1750698 RepID=A0A1S2VLN1_9BACT|nr:alpha/beta fold hydrolase [Arsenicibacter rosenii]OIN59671.1 S9 family peptidase [Arsenicibacter rosenii]
MNKTFTFLLLAGLSAFKGVAQTRPALTVEKIMQDPKTWIGTAPSGVFWSEDARTIYFNWNPDKAKADSLYKISLAGDRKPVKVSPVERRALPPDNGGVYNRAHSLKVYDKNGDLFLLDCKTFAVRQLTNTVDRESNPVFSGDEQRIVFARNSNLYTMHLNTGELAQVTQFDPGTKRTEPKPNEQETWLKKDQLSLFDILRERKAKRDEGEKITKADQPKRPKQFYTDGRQVMNPRLSPDGRFVTFTLMKQAAGAKTANVPNYVTESGFTEDIPARTKVGAPGSTFEFFVYDIQRDTVQSVSIKDVPGITDLPDFKKGVAGAKAATDTSKAGKAKASPLRAVSYGAPVWSEDGKYAVITLRAADNKDRWLLLLDPATRQLKLLDRQRDEAWIAGPGIGSGFGGGTLGFLADNQTLYFQSEADGYSHLYTINVATGVKKQLTSGKFEVQQVVLSKNKQYFFLTTNEVHPGEQHFYRMPVAGGERIKLTTMTGANDVALSPDETKLAIRYSYSNQPWELYLTELKTDKKGGLLLASAKDVPAATKLTSSLSDEFKAYPWRDPAVVTIPARDGQTIYGRLYKPEKPSGKTVVFVHGAGYLQNAHKWWSQYFREYMFHNLLTDKGYTVLDIDYRGSAGYGRDWRTGIYRHMGGKDLTDHVDAVEWLVKNHGVDPKRVGLYGGSYGGFITLMAMFTTPDAFAAGAALRPVTDWAAYNHPYTNNILNEPQADSVAYKRSSPIYFANGLKGHLLICHGMVDVNVHFQDVVRLSQRLIELKKENWELAAYPMEDHGFVEPTSWMDEYKRILKLFDERL